MDVLECNLIYIFENAHYILMEKRLKDYLDGLVSMHFLEIARRPYYVNTGWEIFILVQRPRNVYIAGNDSESLNYVRKSLLERLSVIGQNSMDIVIGGRDDFDGDYIIFVDEPNCQLTP